MQRFMQDERVKRSGWRVGRGMLAVAAAAAVTAMLALAPASARAADLSEAEQAELDQLRNTMQRMIDAAKAGDEEAAAAYAAEARSQWESVDAEVRAHLESRRAGAAQQIESLIVMEGDTRTFTPQGTTQVDDGRRMREDTLTNEQGEVVRTRKGVTERVDESTVKHHHERYNADGEVIRSNDTVWTKTDDQTRERDTTVTHRDGTESRTTARHERDGDAVNTSKQVTTREGDVYTYEGQRQKTDDGGTMSGTWSDVEGNTVRTVEGSRQRDEAGNVTYDKTWRDAEGEQVRNRTGSRSKDGDTITRHDETTNRRGGGRTYDGTSTRGEAGGWTHEGKVQRRRGERPERAEGLQRSGAASVDRAAQRAKAAERRAEMEKRRAEAAAKRASRSSESRSQRSSKRERSGDGSRRR